MFPFYKAPKRQIMFATSEMAISRPTSRKWRRRWRKRRRAEWMAANRHWFLATVLAAMSFVLALVAYMKEFG